MSHLDRTFGDRRERRDPRDLRGEPNDRRLAAAIDPDTRVSFPHRSDVDGDVRCVDLFTRVFELMLD